MKRPLGKKSVSEIRALPRPEDRVPAYKILLEWVLRSLSNNVDREATLSTLISDNAWRFRNVKRIQFANTVRNDLEHGDGKYGPVEWEQACELFDEALFNIANTLSPDYRCEILGVLGDGDGPISIADKANDLDAPIEVNLGLLWATGNIAWPDEVTRAEKYPFTEEKSAQFLNEFKDATFSFHPGIKSIYLHFAKAHLPYHSYADGFLYAETVEEVRRRGRWPQPLGDIHLECGGTLTQPVLAVSPRSDLPVPNSVPRLPGASNRQPSGKSEVSDTNPFGDKEAIVRVCPHCGEADWLLWRFLGRLTHDKCGYTWYAPTTTYAMMQVVQVYRGTRKTLQPNRSHESEISAMFGDLVVWVFCAVASIMVLGSVSVFLVPLQAAVGLCHSSRNATGVARRIAALGLSLVLAVYVLYESHKDANKYSPNRLSAAPTPVVNPAPTVTRDTSGQNPVATPPLSRTAEPAISTPTTESNPVPAVAAEAALPTPPKVISEPDVRPAVSETAATPAIAGPYRIGRGVSAPSVLTKVEPEYSEEARRAKWQGTVVVGVTVDERGVPKDLKVLRSLGLGLDEKALECIARWRFRPGMKDGIPVPVIATIEVNFRLL